MWKKIALNVFFNLGIILSGLGIYWAYSNNSWLMGLLFVFTVAFFVFAKIRLLKDVKNTMSN